MDYYAIHDCNGIEMPDHYSGRRRTYKEAERMINRLNKNGEYAPYEMIGTCSTCGRIKDGGICSCIEF